MGAANPTIEEAHPDKKPTRSPKAVRKKWYSPPDFGYAALNSA